jgi:hypothetical protein
VTWIAVLLRPLLRFSNSDSSGQPGRFGETTANKKPGAVSRPGIVAYSSILCFSYEIR